MCGSMVDIQPAAAEIRRGIKNEDRKKPQGKNIMYASAMQGGHNNELVLLISIFAIWQISNRQKLHRQQYWGLID